MTKTKMNPREKADRAATMKRKMFNSANLGSKQVKMQRRVQIKLTMLSGIQFGSTSRLSSPIQPEHQAV
jgi:hypothetical protein